MDYKFKTEPYAHQLHALGASHNKENYALFMEMGTGKSKVLVDNIAMLYDKGKINSPRSEEGDSSILCMVSQLQYIFSS